MVRITIDQCMIGDIPVLTMQKDQAEGYPLVIFIHGFTSDKQEGLSLGYDLEMKGFYFVAFDAVMHGDRSNPRLEQTLSCKAGNIYPVESGLDAYNLMHEIIVQIGVDIHQLISYFEDKKRIDIGRIGLTGFSMGGFATFYCAANNPRIGAVAPAAGIPAFEDRWEGVVLETSSYEAWSNAMDSVVPETARRTSWMREIEHRKTP